MTEATRLDLAHAAMIGNPDDDAARLRFYERIADAELFVLLETEATAGTIEPVIFNTDDGRFVLAFDGEDRLAAFAGGAAPYAALSGRIIAGMLRDEGYGLALNIGVAPSEFLLPPEAADWLMRTLSHRPQQAQARARAFGPPTGIPEPLLHGLAEKLSSAGGLARAAYLVAVSYEGNARGHLLAFVDAKEGARTALAGAASEALTFSGIEAGQMDVGFFDASDPVCARLAGTGLRFDLPVPATAEVASPAAPGSDPARPPILR